MNGHEHSGERLQDDALDALVRATVPYDDETGFPVSEEDLLDYLEGRAADEAKDRIRVALAESPGLRSMLLEVANDQAALKQALADGERAAAEAYFAKTRAAAQRPWYETISRVIAGLVLKPAFAYSLVVVLVAYPAFRHFTSDGSPPMVQIGGSLNLDELDPTLRGDEEADLPAIDHSFAKPVLSLTLWSKEPFKDGQFMDLDVSLDDQPIWDARHVPLQTDPTDPYRLDLQLDMSRIGRGRIHIHVLGHDGSTGDLTHDLEFGFDVK